MEKREFLKIAAISGVGVTMIPNALALSKPDLKGQAFSLPKLPYAYDALESNIDEQTMRIHHDKHFQGYTNKLNAAIKGTSYEGKTIEDILRNVTKSDTAVRNNGGGYYNHDLFFASLSPSPKRQPEGKLQKAIEASFGSLKNFKEQFSKSAKTVFGSGWAWLVSDAKGNLSIVSTPNQDSPMMTNVVERSGVPLLGIDVWEHAYYLNYQNRRSEYVEAYWNVLDWAYVEKRYKDV